MLSSFLSKWSIPYISSHSLNWCNKAYISDFEQLSYNTLTFAPILSVLFWNYGELANYNVTKSSSDNLPEFPQTIPFVKQREIAVFKVKYLSSILIKLWFRLDYDYFQLTSTGIFYFNLKSNQTKFCWIWPLNKLLHRFACISVHTQHQENTEYWLHAPCVRASELCTDLKCAKLVQII